VREEVKTSWKTWGKMNRCSGEGYENGVEMQELGKVCGGQRCMESED
jgi:hypothetical protein